MMRANSCACWPDRRTQEQRGKEEEMAEAVLSSTETALENQRIGPLQLRVAALCTLIQVCDAYDVNAVAVTVPSLTHVWNLPGPTFTQAFVWSSIGILVGALSAGPIGDRLGRRPLLLASVAIYGLASLLTAFVGSLPMLCAMRFFTSLGIRGRCPGADRRASGRPRPRQPGQDAVRRRLCSADHAVVGDLLLQPAEPVPVRLLAARGPASDRHDAGGGGAGFELPRIGRHDGGALSRR